MKRNDAQMVIIPVAVLTGLVHGIIDGATVTSGWLTLAERALA